MKWSGLTVGLVVALAATTALAERPELMGSRPAMSGQLMRTGQLLGGSNWWTRYGEPVNAVALAQEPVKGEIVPAAFGMHGPDYVYGPGACDCPPPCIDHLWAGYSQHPKRCHGFHGMKGWLRGHGCCCGKGGHGCGDCLSCTKSACGCHEPVSCAAPVTCAAVPDCGCAKPACGCKRVHFHLKDKFKGWMAHWNRGCCDSSPLGCGCTTPVSCGCAMPLDKGGPPPPPVLLPERQAPLSLPTPSADEAAFFDLPRIN
jgi:hypothetical protein